MTFIGQDPESTEYHGHHFQAGQLRFQFRKAKITPKKIGQFVTLWNRNPENNKTEPFTDEDPFDFL
nr:MepB family protein [uncultured Chryseobacterium sp.]